MENTSKIAALPDIFALIIGALFLIAIIAVAIIYYCKATPEKRREIVNEILFALAVEAERLYGGNTGQVKKKQVIAWFYERYKWLSILIKKDDITVWIDLVVDDMNAWLKSNPIGAANIIF